MSNTSKTGVKGKPCPEGMETIEFLGRILPSTGLRCAVGIGSNRRPRQILGASDAWLVNTCEQIDAQGANAYHGCAAFRDASSRKAENVEAVRSFWVDLDVGNDPRKYPSIKLAATHVMEFCHDIGLPAPLIVRSGNGLHCYWPMSDDMSPDEWLPAARSLKQVAKDYGLKADPSRTADIASILRPPGTHHRKGEPRLVRVVQEGEVGTLAAFQGALDRQQIGAPRSRKPAATASINDDLTAGQDFPPSSGVKIAGECAVMALMRDTRGDVDQPTWYHSLGVLAFTEEGEALCHEWSGGHPAYTPAETDKKIAQVLKFAPTTCGKLSEAQPDLCQACPHFGKIASPIVLGFEIAAVTKVALDNRALPEPLPRRRAPVPPFSANILPQPYRDACVHIAATTPVPIEFVATNTLVAGGALLGNRVGVNFKQRGVWAVLPNAWGLVIGDVSTRKTAAQRPVATALGRIDAANEREYRVELDVFRAQEVVHQAHVDHFKQAARKAVAGGAGAPPTAPPPAPVKPVCKRTHTNSSTPEAMARLCGENPTGILQIADEISGYLAMLDRDENRQARTMALTGWDGQMPFRDDRITREGHVIPRFALSVLGSIQPGPLERYLVAGARNGTSADGLAQRFGMMVWPDVEPQGRLVDEPADFTALDRLDEALKALASLDPLSHGAQPAIGDGIPLIGLDDNAYQEFNAWYDWHLKEAHNDAFPDAYRDHVLKLPKVIASIALQIHLLEGCHGKISRDTMSRATAGARFFAAHAYRVYTAALTPGYDAGRRLARRISRAEITGSFTTRDAVHRGWAGCGTAPAAEQVLDVLTAHRWLTRTEVPSGVRGGRPTIQWEVHPAAVGAPWE